MNILLLGAGGFIGRRTARRLRDAGHSVRTPPHADLDLLRLRQDAAMPLLAGCDAVVNCVGVMSRHAGILETVHHRTPALLAAWAREAGVRRWVQLSALGADAAHFAPFSPAKDAATMPWPNASTPPSPARR